VVTLREILKLDQWPDLVVGPNGFAAKRRIDKAPLAYEIVVNGPLTDEMMEKMIDYAGKADADLTKELFGLCNGIRVGATKFAVYGVMGSQIDRGAADIAYHPPLDINVPNIYGRPKGCPEDYLIVGSSTEDGENQRNQEFVHAITPHGTVVVASEDNISAVSRQYNTVSEWLVTEVQRALSDTTRY
jgi:hypothetical protein